MQAPGRPDEDVRGDFAHGGWSNGYQDEVLMSFAKESMSRRGALLIGSGELVRTLHPAGLIDEYVLLIHPIVLGSGTRLFGPSERTNLDLVRTLSSGTGVIVAQYRARR